MIGSSPDLYVDLFYFEEPGRNGRLAGLLLMAARDEGSEKFCQLVTDDLLAGRPVIEFIEECLVFRVSTGEAAVFRAHPGILLALQAILEDDKVHNNLLVGDYFDPPFDPKQKGTAHCGIFLEDMKNEIRHPLGRCIRHNMDVPASRRYT